jgi:hypothetical protein
MISVQIFFTYLNSGSQLLQYLAKKEFYQMTIGSKQVLCHWCHLSKRELGQKGIGLKKVFAKGDFWALFCPIRILRRVIVPCKRSKVDEKCELRMKHSIFNIIFTLKIC